MQAALADSDGTSTKAIEGDVSAQRASLLPRPRRALATRTKPRLRHGQDAASHGSSIASHPLSETDSSLDAAQQRKQHSMHDAQQPLELQPAPESSAAVNQLPNGWLVLRSIDDAEGQQLVEEAERFPVPRDFVPRRARTSRQRHRPPAQHAASRKQFKQPGRLRKPVPAEIVVPSSMSSPKDRNEDVQNSADVQLAPSGSRARGVQCSMLAVLAKALKPMVTRCKALGVDLQCFPAALTFLVWPVAAGSAAKRSSSAQTMSQLENGCEGKGEHAQSPAAGTSQQSIGTAEAPLMAVVAAEAAGQALSHVLDASMQRVGANGQVHVKICHSDADAAAEQHSSCQEQKHTVDVIVRDSGAAAAADELAQFASAPVHNADSSNGHRHSKGAETKQHKVGSDAQTAIQRLQAGLPIGSGFASLQIAQQLLQGQGAALSVSLDNAHDASADSQAAAAQWVQTTVSFPALNAQ